MRAIAPEIAVKRPETLAYTRYLGAADIYRGLDRSVVG